MRRTVCRDGHCHLQKPEDLRSVLEGLSACRWPRIEPARFRASLPERGPPSAGARHAVAAMLGALRRRWLIAGAVVLVLVALAAGILVAYRLHQERNIKGSSTVEFTTTTPPKKPVSPPKPQGVVWPLWGYDPPRTRAPEGIKLLPPYRTIWTFNARQLLEFPPAIAYGRLYINSYDGVFYALNEKTGKVLWHYSSNRCAASSAAVGHGVVYATFIGRPPCNKLNPADRGLVAAFNARTGRLLWRFPDGPDETSPLLANGLVYVGKLGRRGVGDRPEDRRPALALQDRRPGQGLRRALRLERDRGLLRRPRLRRRRQAGLPGLARVGPAALQPVARNLLLDPRSRLRPRLHRQHRRQDLLVRGEDRASSAGRTRPAATSTHRPASGTSASTPAPTTARSTPSTPRPAKRSGRSRPRARSRARRRSSTASSTSRASRTAPMRSTPPPGSSSGASAAGHYTPVVADAKHLYLVGYGRLYGMIEKAKKTQAKKR